MAGRSFEKINLDAPELRGVRQLYRDEKYEQALGAYRDIFVDRLAGLDFGYVGGWGHGGTSANDLLEGHVQIRRHAGGASRNYIGNLSDWPQAGCE
ncbi:MAG: hypothetical protein ABIF82_08645 [Planctomycetota bacterium]